MALAIMGACAPSFQPSDYADLMDELALCRSPEEAHLWSFGTVARRNAMPQPWRNAVNAALARCLHPVDDGTLQIIRLDDGINMGIGTVSEVRQLIVDGILPHTVILMPLCGEAA